MSQENGAAEVTQLSEPQLKLLNFMLNNYLQERTSLEARIAVINKTMEDIAGAYLAGLGVSQTMHIDLATGGLTPLAQPVVGPGP